jgi:predicted Zn finger-like uncharacterized protein
MILTCPNCATRFEVNGAAFGDKPRKVRCASCKETWTQEPNVAGGAAPAQRPAPAPAPVPAPAPAPAPPPQPVPEPTPEPAPAPEEPNDAELTGDDDFPFSVQAESEPQDHDDNYEEDIEANDTPPDSFLDNVDLTPSKPLYRKPDRKKSSSKLKTVFYVFLLLVFGAGLVAGYILRDKIVQKYPIVLPAYEILGIMIDPEGLAFIDFKHKYEPADEAPEGKLTLVITGKVENLTAMEKDVPSLRIDLFNENQDGIYYWIFKAKSDKIYPSGTVFFETRLVEPPEGAHDMRISFDDIGHGNNSMDNDHTMDEPEKKEMPEDMKEQEEAHLG